MRCALMQGCNGVEAAAQCVPASCLHPYFLLASPASCIRAQRLHPLPQNILADLPGWLV